MATPSPAHDVDLLFDQAAQGPRVTIPDGWGQGRATFGGLVAGVMVARTLGAFDLDPSHLRSLTTSFVAPVDSGPALIDARLLRRGRSATAVQVELRQVDAASGEETVRAAQSAVFGAPRESQLHIHMAAAPPLVHPVSVAGVPFLPGLTPDFFAHVELRPTAGQVPFSGAPTGDAAGFIGFRQPPAQMGLPAFVTLADGWPPAPGQCLSAPAAMSTLTWTLEMLEWPTVAADHKWSYTVITDAAHDGYAHTHARIATAEGDPVAISRQTIALFG